MYYIYNFVLYSILGFIIEIIFKVSFNFQTHSGFLFGPYCVVYGFGITFIYFIFEKIEKKLRFHTIIKYFLYFLLSFVILSVFEFIGGYFLELILDKTLWNYKNHFLNIGKYISLEMSFLWSVGAILAFTFLKPLTDKIYFKINKNIIKISLLIMLIDFILTLIFKLK